MAVKKKTTRKVIPKKVEVKQVSPAIRVVTEVVEEVPSESLEEIKQDAQNIEKTVEELEAVTTLSDQKEPEEEVVTSGDQGEEVEEDERKPEETHKIVVEKLFKQDNQPAASEITVHQTGNPMKSVIVWVLTVVVVALLTGGGLLLLVKGLPAFSTLPLMAKPTPTLAPTPTPTSVPVAPSREDVKVQVLNGGGNPGAGSLMKKLLESKGYEVVEVGNTDEYTYDTTEIVVKNGKEGILNLLKEDLKDSYTLGDSTDTVPDDAAYDARVIAGKE